LQTFGIVEQPGMALGGRGQGLSQPMQVTAQIGAGSFFGFVWPE
jgi:hypothetical protein